MVVYQCLAKVRADLIQYSGVCVCVYTLSVDVGVHMYECIHACIHLCLYVLYVYATMHLCERVCAVCVCVCVCVVGWGGGGGRKGAGGDMRDKDSEIDGLID